MTEEQKALAAAKQKEWTRRWRERNREHLKEYGRAWRAAHPEHAKGVVEWRKANPEKVKEQFARWREKNLEHKKKTTAEWYQRNADHARAVSREWGRKNPQKRKETWQRFYEKNYAKLRIAVEIWRKNNPERSNAIRQKARVRRRDAMNNALIVENMLTTSQWCAQIEYFGNACAYCLRPLARVTMDHIVPVSKGGVHTIDNVLPACKTCNCRKHANGILTMLKWNSFAGPEPERGRRG